MFIGHFGLANAAAVLLPQVPPLVLYTGVSFPDLLWGTLILLGVEKARMPADSPLQTRISFDFYPYSHSLVLTNLLALVPAAGIALYTHSAFNGLVFVLASVSHWLLDLFVHHRDLPVLGFGRDIKVGLGGWDHPWLAFIGEYLLYAVPTALFVPSSRVIPLLVLGLVIHLVNANAFFGWTRRNPFHTVTRFALVTLLGFAGVSWGLHGLI